MDKIVTVISAKAGIYEFIARSPLATTDDGFNGIAFRRLSGTSYGAKSKHRNQSKAESR